MSQSEPPEKVKLKDNHGTLQVAQKIVNHCTACAEREALQRQSDRFFRWIFPATAVMSFWVVAWMRPELGSKLDELLSSALLIGGILLFAVALLGTAVTWWRFVSRHRKPTPP